MNKVNDKNTELKSIYEDVMLPNYAPANFIPDRAQGSRVWDKNNKEYIDMGGGIAVNSLGHSNPLLIRALNEQSNKIWHTSNYISNEPAIDLAKKLTELTFAKKVYFSNSGSEANEAAIKMARKYHHDKGDPRDEIISFENSFHGRSILNISIGGYDIHKKGFEPLISGVKHAKFNDINSVKQLISKKTAAIIVEPAQGEAGIYEADKNFLESLRELC
ncbi:MAG TPA: aminotransferase class III-fold pyridoxal phosphate-dependent enzyme, partial [SAR86 cluster bacterium]|nr:aminotransferase class III-fold pyridoxal phosphate-dependent enzyme [SAR86 cluster bacterium]